MRRSFAVALVRMLVWTIVLCGASFAGAADDLKTGRISLESDSRQLITYSLSVTYPDLVNDPARLSKGFTLRKRIENLNGKDEIRVGDVLRVTLNVNLYDPTKNYYYNDGFQYLALEDPVPAGLVPINSALKTEGASKEEASSDTNPDRDSDSGRYYGNDGADFAPDFSEFRDDGVRVFKNRALSGNFQYSYLARAVAEGEFWMRGSRVSLMYDPDVFGRTAGEVVKILPLEK